MNGVFVLLFLISLVGLVWGVISPSHLARKTKINKTITRKHAGSGFGLLMIIFLVLVVATAATTPKTVNLNSTNAAAHSKAVTSSVTKKTTPTTKPVVTTKQVTETQPVSFTTTDENDSSLPKGQTQVKQAGQNGTETLTYNVGYTNGQQTSKTLASTVVTTPAVNQIVEVGTYVAPVAPAPTPTVATPPAPSASSQSCTPLSDEGTCYEPGEYCRSSDEGISGMAGDGKSIECEENDGLRWEPI